MRCPKCGLENPTTAMWCDCGYDFTKGKMRNAPTATGPAQENLRTGGSGFFSFKTMLSPTIIKVVYAIGMLVITGLGASTMAGWQLSRGRESLDSRLYAITGLLILIVGNILWRIACEFVILQFSIHELLGSIDDHLESR